MTWDSYENPNPLSILKRTGKSPYVSVLIPTRTRPESRLKQVVTNCIEKASVPKDLEFCIKVDSDDHEALNLSHHLMASYPEPKFNIQVMDRGQGYLDIPRYINELAAKANGDWLWVLGDNAYPVSQHWDLALEQWFPPTATYPGCQDVSLFSPILSTENSFRIPVSPCPFIRRRLFEILGHVTLIPSWDMWLNSVAWLAGTICSVPIAIEHVPPASRTDFDEELINRLNGIRHSTDVRLRAIEDATKIVSYLSRLENVFWEPAPKADGLYYWKSPHNFMLLVYVRDGQLNVTEGQSKLFTSGGWWLPIKDNGDLS